MIAASLAATAAVTAARRHVARRLPGRNFTVRRLLGRHDGCGFLGRLLRRDDCRRLLGRLLVLNLAVVVRSGSLGWFLGSGAFRSGALAVTIATGAGTLGALIDDYVIGLQFGVDVEIEWPVTGVGGIHDAILTVSEKPSLNG